MAVAAEEAGCETLLPGPNEIGQAPFLAPARHVAPAGDEAGGILNGPCADSAGPIAAKNSDSDCFNSSMTALRRK